MCAETKRAKNNAYVELATFTEKETIIAVFSDPMQAQK